ncbi:Hypothetical_protein [Hexamita inflata]|uniref:Hypothetical_protein n=1 Tax=Hexamita inflata TaxID=28002 RepID=A0AA86PEV7_9EUKA|nr:Hypothetical protein HINF_LOCUS22147 [Hexamita inflata]
MMINIKPRFPIVIRLTLLFYDGASSIESPYKFQHFKSIQSKIIRKQKQAEVFCSENRRKFRGLIHLSPKQLGKYIKLYNFTINSQLTQNLLTYNNQFNNFISSLAFSVSIRKIQMKLSSALV